MNLLDRIYLDSVELADSMPDNSTALLIRLALILAISQMACAIAFAWGYRNSAGMVCLLIFGVLFAFLIPIDPVVATLRSTWKLYVLVLALMAIAIVPAALPFFITPYWGWQRILSKAFYGATVLILGLGLLFYS